MNGSNHSNGPCPDFSDAKMFEVNDDLENEGFYRVNAKGSGVRPAMWQCDADAVIDAACLAIDFEK